MSETIAVFDFDGTLVRGNSLWRFLRVSVPWSRKITGACRGVVALASYAFGRMTLSEAKEALLGAFLRGMSADDLNQRCARFAGYLSDFEVPAAVSRLSDHLRAGHTVVIESASCEEWIRPWAVLHGVTEVIGTRLEVDGGCLTGRLATPNCSGQEKVRRFRATRCGGDDYVLHVYGDGPTDEALFAIADHAHRDVFRSTT